MSSTSGASCPFHHGGDAQPEEKKIENLQEGLYYHDYLGLDKILNAQNMESVRVGMPAHDEHLFIVIHQAYELWFKQILHEVGSVIDIFSSDFVSHKQLAIAVGRLHRVTVIQRVLINQVDILETMTPLQFLEFRDLLFPASGFQSLQFRTLEIKLGLLTTSRLQYGNAHFCSYLSPDHASVVQELEKQPSLFTLIEKWLERTPLVNSDSGVEFWSTYRTSVRAMFEEERDVVKRRKDLGDAQKSDLFVKIDSRIEHFESLFDEEKHKKRQERGDTRLSHKALQGALMITLYQHEPLMHYPSQLLMTILEIDEQLTTWRYRHSQMVHRMLGDKVGTGGSSGYRYLQASAAKHRVYTDLFNLSTFLIPTRLLPPLSQELEQLLSFTYERKVVEKQ